MRILLIIALFFLMPGCNAQQKKGLKSIACSFVAGSEPDTVRNVFMWKPFHKLSDSLGPTIFNWQADSSLTITYSSAARPRPVSFNKVKLKESEQALFPSTLLGNKFQFIGVYEDDANKGSGFYLVLYRYEDMILSQLRESLHFLVTVGFLSVGGSENLFEKEGYEFAYKKSIFFKN